MPDLVDAMSVSDTPNRKSASTRADCPAGVAVWLCILILCFSCALDLFFYSGFYASDDASYVAGARRILEDGAFPRKPDLGQIRLTIVGWNTLIAWLFGYKIPLIAGSYIVFHQVLNLLTFALARRMFGVVVGLFAMYFMATAPLAVTFSTAVLPDLPLSCFLVLSLLLFQQGYDLIANGQSRRSLFMLFGAGLSVGFAYMAKEAALVALPFYLVLWLYREKLREKQLALFAGAAFFLGVLVIFLAEWAVLSHLTGHSYIRMGWTAGADDVTSGLREYHYGRYPQERLEAVHQNLRPWFVNTRLDLFLLAAAVVYPFLRGRGMSVWWLAVWFFVYHTWGSTKFTEYLPPSLQPRYFTPLLPLLFAMYSFVIARILLAVPKVIPAADPRKALQTLLIIVLLIHPLLDLHTSDRMAGKIYAADMVNTSTRAVRAAARAGGRPIVLSGTLSNRALPILSRLGIESVVTAKECRSSGVGVSELLRDGFYYVELYPIDKLQRIKRPDGLDALVHPLLVTAFDEEDAWTEPQRRRLGEVEIGGRRGVLRGLGRFDSWHKRTEHVAHVITPLARRRPDRGAWATYLYEWTPLTGGGIP